MNEKKNVMRNGKLIMSKIHDELPSKIEASLGKIDSELPDIITEYVFGSILAREGLDLKTRELVTVAALIALGNAQSQLLLHMKGALKCGATKQELLEVVIQMMIYSGVPSFMNAINIFEAITQEQ